LRVDDFALARGATEPIASKQTAERVWEPKFLGEIMAGCDPHVAPAKPVRQGVVTVAEFLDRYCTNYVEAEGLKSARTISGHVKALKASLGDLPVAVLEKPTEIVRFKAAFRHGHQVATVNRVLGILRAAINWGRFQDPPLLSTTPFHRFGVNIRARDETKRDRRVHRDEEKALLAACGEMNSAEHKWVGPAMHDRIIGALETCCRQGEMLRIQNKHVDWSQHQIVIPGANAKDSENRRIPFDPRGRLAPILKRRAGWDRTHSCLAHSTASSRTASRQPGVAPARRARSRHQAQQTRRSRRSGEAEGDRSALARSPSRGRMPTDGGRRRHPDHPIDARTFRHQNDAALLEHHRRGNAQSVDGRVGTSSSATGDHREPLRIVSHLSVT
jgi:integrase